MVDRLSALAGHSRPGKFGILGENAQAGVILQDVQGLVLFQVAAWPATIDEVGKLAASIVGCKTAPGPCQSAATDKASLLRVEPLKWWVIGTEVPDIEAEKATTLDLSHSRCWIRISGPQAVDFLNRHMSLDLRENSFPAGSVGSTAIHHVGVTLWRSSQGYELFIPRGFALSLWEGFVASAKQFGLEVV